MKEIHASHIQPPYRTLKEKIPDNPTRHSQKKLCLLHKKNITALPIKKSPPLPSSQKTNLPPSV